MRIVVKVGSSSLHDGTSPRMEVFHAIADDVAEMSGDSQFVVVTSGAILFGKAALAGIDLGEDSIERDQVFASAGQRRLMDAWADAFSPYGEVGQILATNQELLGKRSDEKRHISGVLELMLAKEIRPIVNENDAVATDEIKQGDNDRLSAYIADLIGANLLFLLGQEDGFYRNYGTENEELVKLMMVSDLEHNRQFAGESMTGKGTGGMGTKFDAAEIFLAVPNRHLYIAPAIGERPITSALNRLTGTLLES